MHKKSVTVASQKINMGQIDQLKKIKPAFSQQTSGVKTRAQEKNQKKISTTLFDQHFKQKDIQRWLEADDLELVFFKRIGRYICSTLISFGTFSCKF